VEHEEWGDMPQGVLRGSLTGKVCITCQCFGYETDAQCRTLLVCNLHRAHLPQGQHLTKKCRNWTERLEKRIGWAPEVA
jgi:hypothetical protein